MAVNGLQDHQTPILIIGAGITGCLIAQGLKKASIPYIIFDAENPNVKRAREWTLNLHWSIPMLEDLLPDSLYRRLAEAQCDPTYDAHGNETVVFLNSATGKEMKTISAPGIRRVSRSKMRKLCSEGIDVLWEKTLVGVAYDRDGATAHFGDASYYRGSVILGADGPNSKVRHILLGEEKARTTELEIGFLTANVKYNNAEKARHVRSGHPVVCPGFHPKGMFNFISVLDIPDPNDPKDWTFQIASSWLGNHDHTMTNEERRALLKERVKDLAEPYRSANLWIPDETIVHHDPMTYWIPMPWDNHEGRVTLAGDAVHPLPPYRGQGGNHSIQDALNLVSILTKIEAGSVSRAEGVSRYEEEVIKRGTEEVQISVKTALTVHSWESLLESPLMKHGLTKMS